MTEEEIRAAFEHEFPIAKYWEGSAERFDGFRAAIEWLEREGRVILSQARIEYEKSLKEQERNLDAD